MVFEEQFFFFASSSSVYICILQRFQEFYLINGVLFCTEMFYTSLSLSLSLCMGSVLAWCVCVLHRIDCAMSCHVCGRTSTYLPTDLLATLHLLILQWTKTNLLLALALAFDCNFIQLRCVPFSMQCSPIHPCMHANI